MKTKLKGLGIPSYSYAVEKWESYKSTWMPVERVQSNKKSCDQLHMTEGQEIFLRILGENVTGQSKVMEGDTPLVPKSHGPTSHPALLACSSELSLTQVDLPSLYTWWKGAASTGSHRSWPALQRAE